MATNLGSVDEIRRRVAALRRPDLQECLERLGMRKTGNKPDLQQRLLDIFEDALRLTNSGQPPRDIWRVSAAERVVNEIYNRLMSSGGGNANGPQGAGGAGGSGGGGHAADDTKPRSGSTGPPATGSEGTLAGAMSVFFRDRVAAANAAGSRGSGGAAASGVAPVVRCCCGSNADRQPLVQCRSCGVWQHRHCVGLPALAPGARAAGSDEFSCELCRAKRADPFWQVEDADIAPAIRLSSTGKQTTVSGAMQHMRTGERTFTLTSQQLQKIKGRQTEHQLQLACLQMNDSVPFRFHWPLMADLRVNNVQYRVYSRNSTQKLGANARDEPANIGQLWSGASGGRFHLVMQCADNSAYAMIVLLMRRRSTEEVKRLMAKQLSVEDALKRVQLQLARDDDDELQTGATVVSLRCPILGTRLRTPARFEEVKGLACFDLEAFLDSAARTRKWQCPTSMAHSTVHSLQIDTYTQRIISALADFPLVMEVEVESDGSWRPAGWKDRFYSIMEDNPLAAAAAAGAGGSGPGGLGPSGAAGGADSNGEEETDEEEELRRAAAAMSVAVGQKRKRPPTPDVIDLLSSDEEDGGGGCRGLSAVEPATTTQHQANGVIRASGQEGTSTGGNGDTVATHMNGVPLASATTVPVGTGGSGATANAGQHVPLRIVLPTRRLLTTARGVAATQQQHQSVVGNGPVAPSAGPRAAFAAAGTAVMATQRQHLDQVTSGSLSRHQPHHHSPPQTGAHGQQAAQQSHLATAGTSIPPPPSPPPQQQQQLGLSTVSTAGAGAADASCGGGLSHHQLANTTSHVQVRNRLTGGPQDGTAGLTPLPVGAPVTALYQALGRPGTAAAGSMGGAPAGPAAAAVPSVISVISAPAAGHNSQQPAQQFAFPIVSQQAQAASLMLHVPWLQQRQHPPQHINYHATPPQQQPQAYRPTVGPQQFASAQQHQEQQQQQQQQPPPPPQPQTQTQAQAQAQCGGVQAPPFPALSKAAAPQAQGAVPSAGGHMAGYGAASNHAVAAAIGTTGGRCPYECIDLLDDSGEDN